MMTIDFKQLALAGQCFIGTGPVAGVAIPIQSSTTMRFALWNPSESGVNVMLNTYMQTKVDAADPGVGGYLLGLILNTGGAAATGAPVATFTNVTPINALLAGGKAPRARFGSAATAGTLTTASSQFYSLGLSRETVTDTVGPVLLKHSFDGALVLAPGTLVHLVGIAADTQVSMSTITWAEIPIV
jgi:hypothetical protein